jgi:DNA polymerase III delta prime subunit
MIEFNQDEMLWTEKYRPKTIDQCILPAELKHTFMQFVNDKQIPNLILAGKSGVGKTTVARALLNQLGFDYIIINGSLNGNIDTLRVDIKNFASTVSLTSNSRKYVIIDEADYLNPQSTQPALRNFMEQYANNCGFILTCNYKNKIIEPLHSRTSVIEFAISKKDFKTLATEFYHRLTEVLKNENIAYDNAVIAQAIAKYFPDWRRLINEIQRYCGKSQILDKQFITTDSHSRIDQLIDLIKTKKITEIRQWVGQSVDLDQNTVFTTLYRNMNSFVEDSSIPQLVVIIADYQYKAAFVVDQEINLTACCYEIINSCVFKS